MVSLLGFQFCEFWVGFLAGTELKLAIYPLHIVQLICEILNAVIDGNDGMDGFV